MAIWLPVGSNSGTFPGPFSFFTTMHFQGFPGLKQKCDQFKALLSTSKTLLICSLAARV